MKERISDRIFAAFGIGFVVLLLVGNVFDGDLHGSGITASTAAVAAKIAKPIPSHAWIGVYLEMLAVGCFLAFATWATAKLGSGLLAQLARAAAAAYAAVIVVSLGLMAGTGYAYGHGITVPVARTFDAVNKLTYAGSWFLSAFFLIALGAQALKAARPRIGWSAVGIGVVTLAVAPAIDSLGELSVFLWFGWVVAVSIALARGGRAAAAAAVPQHA